MLSRPVRVLAHVGAALTVSVNVAVFVPDAPVAVTVSG